MSNGKEKSLNTEEQEKVIMINDDKNDKNKSKLNKRIYIDTPLRIFVLAGFVFIFAFLSLIFLKKGLETKTYTSIYYSEKSNLDYKVYLKENPYFNEPFLMILVHLI